MTDEAELQTEESGTDEIGEESASSEKAPEGFIRAEDAQKDINKQHRKYRDEERARKKVEAEAERYRKELEELRAKSVDVTVPPIPDRYDDDYEQKIKERDEALLRKAQHDSQLANKEAESERVAQERRSQEEQALQQKIASFDSNMVSLGLNPLEVKQAADTLVDYEISDTLQDILLEDAEGPLLVKYLADNPVELDTLSGLSTLQLVEHLRGDIRQRANLLRPKTSAAPDPPVTLSGGGVRELEDPLLKGATFE